MEKQQDQMKQMLEGPKPIAIEIPGRDIQMLHAMNTDKETFAQLILAKLKDAGAPVEGVLRYSIAHGKVYKVRDSVLVEQDSFQYIWMPEAYCAAMEQGVIAQQAGNA